MGTRTSRKVSPADKSIKQAAKSVQQSNNISLLLVVLTQSPNERFPFDSSGGTEGGKGVDPAINTGCPHSARPSCHWDTAQAGNGGSCYCCYSPCGRVQPASQPAAWGREGPVLRGFSQPSKLFLLLLLLLESRDPSRSQP